jgi:hypothetical protein
MSRKEFSRYSTDKIFLLPVLNDLDISPFTSKLIVVFLYSSSTHI